VVCLDTDWGLVAKALNQNLISKGSPDNLAYVMYTSGSTGRPKGVMSLHRGICNRLHWMQQAYQLTRSDIVLQKTPFSFDVSVWEFFWPLITGARLVLAQPGGHQDTSYLVKLIAERQITTVHFVPSMLRLFLEEPGLEICNSLRRVICSGEVLPFEVQERFFGRLNATLHNLYGPTEASIDVTYSQCTLNDLRIVPIGRPIFNTQIYLLDSRLQPVPVGVTGELHIGGVSVGRGYLNRPELTAEKFIANPFSGVPGARLYRTGDLARYLPDGNIEFLGRIDRQVKIRGFRIELGEIESLLSQHSEVGEAVVLLAPDEDSGDKRLVAYITGLLERCPTSDDLKDFLKTKLPGYMLPSKFVFLDSLPLTANGKVDRQALAAIDRGRATSNETIIDPRNHLERQLANICKSILRVKTIGVKDNFFDLGGHSLLALHVISQIKKVFGKKLSLASFFQKPTVEQLAKLLGNEFPVTPSPPLLPIQTNGTKCPFFMIDGHTSYAALSRYLDPDQPLYGLLHESYSGQRARHTSVEEIAAHYLSEIRTIQPRGPYLFGGYSFGGVVAFEMAQQLKKTNEKVALLVLLAPSPLKKNRSRCLTRNIGVDSIDHRFTRHNFSRHLHNLKLLEPQERLTYVLKKIKGTIVGPGRETAEKAICKIYMSLGYRLPVSLRMPYILDVYVKARRRYNPKVYPGRLIIYNAAGDLLDPQTWEPFAAAGLEIHNVPGGHLDILKEPNVKDWGNRLRTDLQRVQSELRGSEDGDERSEVGNRRSA
jgi:amino acid adenylation domain-containing protein